MKSKEEEYNSSSAEEPKKDETIIQDDEAEREEEVLLPPQKPSEEQGSLPSEQINAPKIIIEGDMNPEQNMKLTTESLLFTNIPMINNMSQ